MKIVIPTLILLAAACTSADPVSTTPTTVAPSRGPDAGVIVLTAEQNGGCAMMGPNCERFVVYGDGSVEVYRAGEGSNRPLDVAVVDPELVVTLDRVVGSTDFETLRTALPVGECRACFDGIDYLIQFTVDGLPIAFDSVETELTPAEPVFRAMWAVIDAASSATEIPVVTR